MLLYRVMLSQARAKRRAHMETTRLKCIMQQGSQDILQKAWVTTRELWRMSRGTEDDHGHGLAMMRIKKHLAA